MELRNPETITLTEDLEEVPAISTEAEVVVEVLETEGDSEEEVVVATLETEVVADLEEEEMIDTKEEGVAVGLDEVTILEVDQDEIAKPPASNPTYSSPDQTTDTSHRV